MIAYVVAKQTTCTTTLQYENRRADYVEAIWNIVDWSDVVGRFEHARHTTLIDSP